MGREKIGLTPAAADALAVLGSQIRVARTQKNWSSEELARQAGVSRATVSGVENGNPSVSIGNVLNIAVVAGVRLFGVEDPSELIALRRRGEQIVALLPARVGHQVRSSGDLDF